MNPSVVRSRSPSTIGKHEEDCAWAPIACPGRLLKKCPFVGSRSGLHHHVLETGCALIQRLQASTAAVCVPAVNKPFGREPLSWSPTLILDGGQPAGYLLVHRDPLGEWMISYHAFAEKTIRESLVVRLRAHGAPLTHEERKPELQDDQDAPCRFRPTLYVYHPNCIKVICPRPTDTLTNTSLPPRRSAAPTSNRPLDLSAARPPPVDATTADTKSDRLWTLSFSDDSFSNCEFDN